MTFITKLDNVEKSGDILQPYTFLESYRENLTIIEV